MGKWIAKCPLLCLEGDTKCEQNQTEDRHNIVYTNEFQRFCTGFLFCVFPAMASSKQNIHIIIIVT